MSENRNATLLASWHDNAARWSEAVRSGRIASRRLVTDSAVVAAIRALKPQRVLDLGCGEGWLTRALAAHVDESVGVDVSPELIEKAQALGGGTFRILGYDALIDDPLALGGFDVVVANFALLDDRLEPLLHALARIGRHLVIQTLHPGNVPGTYEDGWRQEDFTGFGDGGWTPMPWYFRTTASWLNAVSGSWRLVRVDEPLHPETGRPAALLITAAAI